MDQASEELKQRFQQRRNDYLDTGKDKTSVTKISCLGQTARNFVTVSGRLIPMRKMHQRRRKWRTSGGKYMGNEFNITERRTGLKTITEKIQACNGAQYVKKTLQRH